MPGSDPGLPGGPATRGPAPGQTGVLAGDHRQAMHLARTGCRKHRQHLQRLREGVAIQAVSLVSNRGAKEAWPSLVMTESQHPRHRRGLGPARDEPPSQNRVHGWGSVCCVMRSCSARGHGNQRDRELSRIWTCESRRCRPPQTGEPETRENIAASRRTTVTTTATRLRCCHPPYPCIRVAPFSPVRSGLATETRLEAIPPPIHPWDPDLVRRPWSQNCPSTTPCQSFGPRDTSPTSKIASAAVGRCPLCCDSKLIAWDGRARWFARASTPNSQAPRSSGHQASPCGNH